LPLKVRLFKRAFWCISKWLLFLFLCWKLQGKFHPILTVENLLKLLEVATPESLERPPGV
jgi:hypothetical protein